MQRSASKLYSWAMQKASSSKAPLWVAILFFLEIFLFIPLDALLMFFCLENRAKIPLYVLIAAVSSTISGVLGYLAGHFLWDLIGSYIVPHFISSAQFARISGHFEIYEHWAIFFGSLFPFPLKALSLTAGVFHLGIIPFILSMFGARLLRFLMIGMAMAIWGEKVKEFIEKHFHRLLLIVSAKVAIALVFFWMLAQ